MKEGEAMKARALISQEDQTFSIQEVELPEPAPDEIGIRTSFSGVSVGTEFALITKKISWKPFPLCTGYMGTGVVEAVGSNVRDFHVGEKVYFRGQARMALGDGRQVGCVSGAHCSHVVTTPHTSHGVGKLPAGAGMDAASLFVMFAVGLNGVDMAAPRMGQTVAVYGVGLIGLSVVLACALRGCRVVALDINDKQLEIAKEMGADHVIHVGREDSRAALRSVAPDGADVVFECTGIKACIDPAIQLCRPLGTFVWQGHQGEGPVPFDFSACHGRQLRMVFPCDDGMAPCREAVVKNLARGAMPIEKAITHSITWKDAPDMYARIHSRKEKDIVGVVINWDA